VGPRRHRRFFRCGLAEREDEHFSPRIEKLDFELAVCDRCRLTDPAHNSRIDSFVLNPAIDASVRVEDCRSPVVHREPPPMRSNPRLSSYGTKVSAIPSSNRCTARDLMACVPAFGERTCQVNAPTSSMLAHQPGQERFHVIRAEDVVWKPFAAFPPLARLAILVGAPEAFAAGAIEASGY
jgi:hypothetical protein